LTTGNATFSSENILVSIAGHLGVIAIMITTFTVFEPMVRIVAPDHIQIMEIDLSRVQITRDETLVYNVQAPTEQQAQEQPAASRDRKEEQPLGDEKPAETQTAQLVEEQRQPEARPEPQRPAPPPVQRTTVRVNRETATLNRTMTVSVVDALRVAMTRCWQFDRNRPGIEELRVVAHLTMNRNGMVRDIWFESARRAETDPAFAYIVETIRGAISICQPFRMLPQNEFEHWQNIQLTFYPSNATVQ